MRTSCLTADECPLLLFAVVLQLRWSNHDYFLVYSKLFQVSSHTVKFKSFSISLLIDKRNERKAVAKKIFLPDVSLRGVKCTIS